MNTLETWKNWKDEAGELRGDKYEGILQYSQQGRKVKYSRSLLMSNGFCMHAINSGNITSLSEEDIEDFNRQMKVQAAAKGLGTHVLFTHNTTELLKRVDTAVHANARWRNYFRGLVDYFDLSTFEGKLTSRASPKPTHIHTNGSTASSFATPGVDRSR